MKMVYLFWFVVLFLFGEHVLAVELAWKLDNFRTIHYRAAGEVEVEIQAHDVDPRLLINDKELFSRVIKDMRRRGVMEPELNYAMTVSRNENTETFRVKMVGVPIVFKGQAKNENEARYREQTEVFINAIRMHADIDQYGRTDDLTFYRTQMERNGVSMLFALPIGPVDAGDTWSLPISLSNFGSGFFDENTEYYNVAQLKQVEITPNGMIGHIEFLVVEHVDGFAKRFDKPDTTKLPFSTTLAYYGFGEFLIDKGYWQRLVGYSVYLGSGYAAMKKKQLNALIFKSIE